MLKFWQLYPVLVLCEIYRNVKEPSGKFRETEGMEPKEGMFLVCLILTENSTKILNFE